jgi:hypothetical protein
LDFHLMRREGTASRSFRALCAVVWCYGRRFYFFPGQPSSGFFCTVEQAATATPHVNPVEITLFHLSFKAPNSFFKLAEA